MSKKNDEKSDLSAKLELNKILVITDTDSGRQYELYLEDACYQDETDILHLSGQLCSFEPKHSQVTDLNLSNYIRRKRKGRQVVKPTEPEGFVNDFLHAAKSILKTGGQLNHSSVAEQMMKEAYPPKSSETDEDKERRKQDCYKALDRQLLRYATHSEWMPEMLQLVIEGSDPETMKYARYGCNVISNTWQYESEVTDADLWDMLFIIATDPETTDRFYQYYSAYRSFSD